MLKFLSKKVLVLSSRNHVDLGNQVFQDQKLCFPRWGVKHSLHFQRDFAEILNSSGTLKRPPTSLFGIAQRCAISMVNIRISLLKTKENRAPVLVGQNAGKKANELVQIFAS